MRALVSVSRENTSTTSKGKGGNMDAARYMHGTAGNNSVQEDFAVVP